MHSKLSANHLERVIKVLSRRNIYIKTVSCEDIEPLIDIHVNSLPRDVLPNLGRTTINRYYAKVLQLQLGRKAALFGAYENSELVGFCCLTQCSVGIFSLISLDTISNLFFMLARNPGLFLKALVQLWQESSLSDSTGEIAYIAVGDRHRSMGIGGLLIHRCMTYCREQKLQCIQTKTSNERLYSHYLIKYEAMTVNEFKVLGDAYHVIKWRV